MPKRFMNWQNKVLTTKKEEGFLSFFIIKNPKDSASSVLFAKVKLNENDEGELPQSGGYDR
jgi:hypothetical protein